MSLTIAALAADPERAIVAINTARATARVCAWALAGEHAPAHTATTNTLADKGYQGTGMVTPIKKKPGEEHLPDHAKQHNRFVNTHRYVIERTIANITTWRIFHTDYRRPLLTFQDAFNAVRGLIFFIPKETNFA